MSLTDTELEGKEFTLVFNDGTIVDAGTTASATVKYAGTTEVTITGGESEDYNAVEVKFISTETAEDVGAEWEENTLVIHLLKSGEYTADEINELIGSATGDAPDGVDAESLTVKFGNEGATITGETLGAATMETIKLENGKSASGSGDGGTTPPGGDGDEDDDVKAPQLAVGGGISALKVKDDVISKAEAGTDGKLTGIGKDDTIGVLTQTGADGAITNINYAIEQVSAERSKLGAIQNRLEHTIANLGTSAENLQAAESRIRDLDMAEEIMAFTKNNILQQAATAMLAQANMAPQTVLQLLG